MNVTTDVKQILELDDHECAPKVATDIAKRKARISGSALVSSCTKSGGIGSSITSKDTALVINRTNDGEGVDDDDACVAGAANCGADFTVSANARCESEYTLGGGVDDETAANGSSSLSSDVKSNRGRGISLKMLMEEGIVESGSGTLVIDYLGRKFVGDLLASGDIRWQENGEIFGSPSAWATHCKRIMNPDKKSGSRWASVKYKGKKLDLFKSMYLRNQLKIMDESELVAATTAASTTSKSVEDDSEIEAKKCRLESDESEIQTDIKSKKDSRRIILKHSTLGNRSSERDPNTLVECTPFCALGKIQPFTVTITTNCLFLMDFHCHLTTSEIVGYLAGHWDVNAHNLAIEQAFPCKCRIGDTSCAPRVEEEIQQNLEKRHMNLVGWYHSHPASPVHPTLRDIDCQMEYQIRLKGNSDASYTPCVGVICSPYETDTTSLESSIQAYWVMPPPENKPQEYGKPMLMTFSLIQENFLPEGVKEEMLALTRFYKSAPDFISFEQKWKDNVTYLEKLQKSLSQKAPLDQMESSVDETIQSLLKPSNSDSNNPDERVERAIAPSSP